MRRRAGTLALGAALALAALTAPAAVAAPAQIEAGTGGADVFSLPSYFHDAGTVAAVTWVGGGTHNATASAKGPDGKPLFRSADITSGSAPVNGTQYVAQGVYPFVCTIHIGMNSSLNVNAGTPLPRPAVTAKAVKGTKLAAVVKKGKLPVKLTVSNGGAATVTVLLGKKQVGASKQPVTKSGTTSIPLSAKGKAALAKKKKKVTLTLNASIDFGSPVSAKATLK
jgi:plastocyanin